MRIPLDRNLIDRLRELADKAGLENRFEDYSVLHEMLDAVEDLDGATVKELRESADEAAADAGEMENARDGLQATVDEARGTLNDQIERIDDIIEMVKAQDLDRLEVVEELKLVQKKLSAVTW